MGHDWASYRSPGHRMIVTTVQVAEQLSKAGDRLLKPYNLSLAQFNLLAILHKYPDGIPQAQIGEELVVSRANVTGLVGRMKKRGMCRTVSDPKDARLKKVIITAAGSRLMEKIEAPYFNEIDRLTKEITDGDLDKASDVMDKVKEKL